jgi:hypothetical protein
MLALPRPAPEDLFRSSVEGHLFFAPARKARESAPKYIEGETGQESAALRRVTL